MPAGHEEPLEVVRAEERRLVGDARARPDERHVTSEDVQQLRQLVERRLPQPAADVRDRVATLELVEPVLADRGPGAHDRLHVLAMLGVVAAVGHRSELERRELLHVLTQARLPEEHRPRRVVLDPPGEEGEQRRRHEQEQARPDDVDRPLHEPRRARDPDRPQAEQRKPLDRMDVDVRRA